MLAKPAERPDLLVASVWRKHKFPYGVPVLLISNENWNLFPPHAPLSRYAGVLGLYPPPEPCRFIEYPYAAVHFDGSLDSLYSIRTHLLKSEKSKFCCFVASASVGDLAHERQRVFKSINEWQHVDSAGGVLNNVGYRAPRGLEFLEWISQYKYMICIENSSAPGYITEKPFQSWFAGTVPIYTGGSAASLNHQAFVDAASPDLLVTLAKMESNPDLYNSTRFAPLTDARLSLDAFEGEFGSFLRELWYSTHRSSMPFFGHATDFVRRIVNHLR